MAEPSDYGASWYASRMVQAPVRDSLALELDVDVCVIGGGLAGLTVAREVAKRNWSVALLEARRVAWNASGRNAGFVLPGFGADPQALMEKVGPADAKTLWELSKAGADYIWRTVRDEQMPGAELQGGGWLRVSKTGGERAMAAHAELLTREFGAHAEFWPAERVHQELRSTHYYSGIRFPDAFTLNPLNYALGLAAAAEAAGARIFEQTPAIEIDPAGVRKRITTPSARLRAGQVVLAGNVHIGGLVPDLANTLVPISTYVIVTPPLGEPLRDAIGFRGAVSDTELADNHYRVVDGDRLMWTGRCTTWQGDPRRYASALAADIKQIYPQLSNVEADYAWTGTFGTTVHRMPQIGELMPGVWILSGFGSQGLATTAMGGNIVARAILDGDQSWRRFQPFDLVWAGGVLGRMATQAAYWYGRSRERAEAFLVQRSHPLRLPAIEPAATVPPESPEQTETAETAAPRKRRRRKAGQDQPNTAEA